MQALDDFDPIVGVPEELESGLQRVVAPNPSPMTYRGTNTYVLGHGPFAVIDPGPLSETHLEVLRALGPISHIFVTHAHLDHSPLAGPLSKATGAPIYAFGPASAGRSQVMQELAESGLAGGGEGIDTAFQPNKILADGDTVIGDNWSLTAMHTPGHIGNHLSFQWNDACFTGDHVMGWASSLVSPPDGDLTDFMASCERLAAHKWRVFYPGHGAPVDAPAQRLDWLITHRKGREASILQALDLGPATASEIAAHVYTDTPAALLPAAARNVLAHLIDLAGRRETVFEPPLAVNAVFRKV